MLPLQFNDLDREPEKNSSTAAYFGPGGYFLFGEHGEVHSICDFMKDCIEREINRLYVHCDAGISRSAGVAAAISKYFLGSDFKFFNCHLTPNMLVYRRLLEGLHEYDCQ